MKKLLLILLCVPLMFSCGEEKNSQKEEKILKEASIALNKCTKHIIEDTLLSSKEKRDFVCECLCKQREALQILSTRAKENYKSDLLFPGDEGYEYQKLVNRLVKATFLISKENDYCCFDSTFINELRNQSTKTNLKN